jgi:hypothetical protein
LLNIPTNKNKNGIKEAQNNVNLTQRHNSNRRWLASLIDDNTQKPAVNNIAKDPFPDKAGPLDLRTH